MSSEKSGFHKGRSGRCVDKRLLKIRGGNISINSIGTLQDYQEQDVVPGKFHMLTGNVLSLCKLPHNISCILDLSSKCCVWFFFFPKCLFLIRKRKTAVTFSPVSRVL